MVGYSNRLSSGSLPGQKQVELRSRIYFTMTTYIYMNGNWTCVGMGRLAFTLIECKILLMSVSRHRSKDRWLGRSVRFERGQMRNTVTVR